MKCPNCNHINAEDAKFCNQCGAKLPVVLECPKCHNKNIPTDSKFCPDCGASLVQQINLKQQADQISSSYPEGFQFFVDNGSLPKFSLRLSNDSCQKIVSMREQIILKQLEMVTKERDDLKVNKKETPALSPALKDFKQYVKDHILPYWPNRRGSNLSQGEINGLESGLYYVQKMIRNTQDMPPILMTKCKFVEQCIIAILEISKGYTPYFRRMIQQAPDYEILWEKLKEKCGEGTYNNYFHYNSGDFADMTKTELMKL